MRYTSKHMTLESFKIKLFVTIYSDLNSFWVSWILVDLRLHKILKQDILHQNSSILPCCD